MQPIISDRVDNHGLQGNVHQNTPVPRSSGRWMFHREGKRWNIAPPSDRDSSRE